MTLPLHIAVLKQLPLHPVAAAKDFLKEGTFVPFPRESTTNGASQVCSGYSENSGLGEEEIHWSHPHRPEHLSPSPKTLTTVWSSGWSPAGAGLSANWSWASTSADSAQGVMGMSYSTFATLCASSMLTPLVLKNSGLGSKTGLGPQFHTQVSSEVLLCWVGCASFLGLYLCFHFLGI